MIKKLSFILFIFMMFNITLLLFPIDTGYLTTLKMPFYFNINFYLLLWTIVIILICYSLFYIILNYKTNDNYNFVVIINYIFSQVFGLFFFYFNNIVISIIVISIVMISSMFIYLETKKIDKNLSFLTIPYWLFNIFNLIYLMIIFLLN